MFAFNLANFKPITCDNFKNKNILHSDTYTNKNRIQTQTWVVVQD